MAKKPEFDLDAAHKYFSAACFNKAWELLDKPDRSEEENDQMVRLSLASHWHWTQRKDFVATNASAAYWQTSRIYAVLGQAENARTFAEKCLEVSQGEDIPPFYLAYAYEALARAECVAGNRDQMEQYLEEARRVTDELSDPDERKWLQGDLATIVT
jgi:tetratricopeptide (TPR) repeat protein